MVSFHQSEVDGLSILLTSKYPYKNSLRASSPCNRLKVTRQGRYSISRMTKRGRPNWGRPKRRRTILASLLLLSSTTPTASNLFTSCYDDLYAADEDGDGIINKDEYIYFVSGLSSGYLASESYGDLPFLLRMNFVELSCRCKYHPRSEEYGGEDCCLGSRQGIYAFGAGPEEIPSEGEEAYLQMACEDTLGAIEYEVGPLPTASPSKGAPLSVDLPENYLFFIGSGPFESGALGLCQGDCDNDGECAGDLVCFQRNGNTTVPGCEGEGRKGSDHCILPEDAPQVRSCINNLLCYDTLLFCISGN